MKDEELKDEKLLAIGGPVAGNTVAYFKQVGLWWECWWHFDQKLVDIVRALPPPGRTWLPEERHWRINPMYVRWLASEIERAGYQIEGLPDTDNLPDERETRPVERKIAWRRDIDG